ncbi:MAG: hypothetical protein KGJ86_00145 [Chloroflexota bacterium]|nr:hypothetical protein [Chloroflexota bacterium]
MATAKGCKDCGQLVKWVAYAVNQKGEYLKGPDGKVIVHKCERRSSGGNNSAGSDQEPTMPFGKYKGWKINSLAATAEGRDYLKWALEKVDKQWLKDAIVTALKDELGEAMRPVQEEERTLGGGESWD